MKKLILIAACFIYASGTMAQNFSPCDFQPKANKEGAICVAVKNGKHIITMNGKKITTDVILESGARITTTGKVIWKDGSSSVLQKGECIDVKGTTYSPRAVVANHRKPLRKSVESDLVTNNSRSVSQKSGK